MRDERARWRCEGAVVVGGRWAGADPLIHLFNIDLLRGGGDDGGETRKRGAGGGGGGKREGLTIFSLKAFH